MFTELQVLRGSDQEKVKIDDDEENMSELTQRCRNCQNTVVGEYCSQCGQREGRADQRFRDLAGELLGDN